MPEEIEDELPLRIRTVTYENEESSSQGLIVDYNKYLDHGSKVIGNNNHYTMMNT